ncbi:ATP-dependent RNA helicase HrpA [Spirilliplanes yamanashiensis]|uniref:RNA helicase n=1 Tax=Spirilliplanes yamanashiensis TaxID=42233 RepID=A0A8J3YAJ9_9ACTN|nr:ATP-dependent RNA helicase HrpA [Spirilliplanes yamanashiensis]MDP9817739.1 ATP-dependent helicase HrpA [Spirilliplanes yamanashiensis]GIJ04549.1 ATP-dependent helicase [Spirilliplanes yamanashiensis]
MSTPDLHQRVAELPAADQRRLRKRLDGTRRIRDAAHRQTVVDRITADVAAAEQRLANRAAARPAVTYPEQLPVSRRREDILAAIRDHQVVVVAGETGSGKTTQLPKMCLELGRGVRGTIGHTQPRRIAARTVAERIAEELGVPLGAAVGYKVRFTDQASDDTLVKVMTDGILLAELQTDRMLSKYDTIIIDEAHERSLNIDFILGYLKQLLPRRPDLKVVITSATIDPQRFADHFGGAPIVEVSGRTYPVEVRYRPLVEVDDDEGTEEPRDQIEAICEAVDELAGEAPGDVLVFLSGEREIRDTADALAKRNLRNTEILPLYARLSAAEQHRVFQPHTGRRVVLATNVAETSLTVPGIRYVVDPGTARISRYSNRLKVQRLPIEPVSQASANQRKGRCGRTSDGICIRLYSEEDFASRPEFTDPEILRTNLASVILQMSSLGLGDLAAFPFVDPPDRRTVADGVKLLEELGAFDRDGRLTALGRKLAQLPVDPRLARMVIEADAGGVVPEVLVVAAALSIQDPRERPAEKQQAADEKHARFTDRTSDFLTLINLWKYLREQQEERSSSAFRRMCKAEFLNYLRVREWQDVHAQLRQVARTLGIESKARELPAETDGDRLHAALLSGLLSHMGMKEGDRNEYLGARGAKFAIFPGSALAKKPPRWVMAAELVETSRLWGRVAASVEPEWAERLAGHLVKRSYSEPHWEKKQGAVVAYEKVSLYGLPIVAKRKVNFGRIDPVASRDLFIRHALVEGDWQTHHAFFAANRALLGEVEELEHRARRRDILVDDETLYAFYDQRIPADVVSGRHFDSWWKKARHADPELLTFSLDLLVNEGKGGLDPVDYPDTWRLDGLELPLSYQFEPGDAADGVTVEVPVALLNRLDPAALSWQVPGLRRDVVIALIRGLPKAIRTHFVPVPDHADAVLPQLRPDGSLLDALTDTLRRLTGVIVPREAWQPGALPEHLRINVRVVGEDGATLGEGRDVAALRAKLAPAVRQTISKAAASVERRGLTAWGDEIGTLPRRVAQDRGGFTVHVFPALADEGDTVAVRVVETEAEQRVAMRAGTRRLLLLGLPSPAKYLTGRLDNRAKLALSRNPHRSVADLLDDCAGAAVDQLVDAAGGPAWDAAGFAALRERVRAELVPTVEAVVQHVRAVLGTAYDVERRVAGTADPRLLTQLTDIRAQLARMIYRGFVTETGWRQLPHLPRYLQAVAHRLDRLPGNLTRDTQLTRTVQEIQAEYDELRAELPRGGPADEGLTEIRWMIEELRVSYFAQGLGTAYSVSPKRIYKAMDELPV